MKKIYTIGLILSVLVLAGCGKNTTNTSTYTDKQIEQKLNTDKKLINVDKKINKLKKEFTKLGFTGDKLENLIKEQRKNYEILANLSGDNRKKYIFEKIVLPDLVKKTPSFCKTNDINLYAKCIYKKGVKLEDIEKQLPSGLKNYFKKIYYFQKYNDKKSNLLKKTSDKIAIEQKKEVIKTIYAKGILKSKDCNKLPEQETKSFCLGLFK